METRIYLHEIRIIDRMKIAGMINRSKYRRLKKKALDQYIESLINAAVKRDGEKS